MNIISYIKENLNSLASREQKMLIVGSIVCIILLGYLFIWRPFFEETATIREQVIAQKQLLQWMQVTAKEIKALHEQGFASKTIGDQSLLTFIDTSTDANQLDQFVSQIHQTNNNAVAINFNSVPFDSLLSWLTILWKQYNIKVISFSANPADKHGLTTIELILQK